MRTQHISDSVGRALAAAAVLFGLHLVLRCEAHAQECSKDCPPEQQDASGCCPVEAPKQPQQVVSEPVSPFEQPGTEPATSEPPAASDTVGSVIDRYSYEMVQITTGEFWMGSSSGEKDRDDDETRHRVSITQGFAIGTTEVTQALYEAVMGENPSHFKSGRNPVEQVSWHDAVQLCNRLSEEEGLEKAYRFSGLTVTWHRSASGYRLPTEAEWEYAARGGEEQVYSGSDDIDDVGWYSSNSGTQTHEVGGKQANGWGLYDMTGNVWEWVWDWYWPYPSGTVTDPVGRSTGSYRVRRGGSWDLAPRDARVADRDGRVPGRRNRQLGFRLARSIP